MRLFYGIARRGALALGLVLLLTSAPAAIRFDMFVGYDNIVPQGNWFPITFEAQNDGPAFTALLEVSPDNNANQTRRMVVELPTGTTKRFSIPVFTAANYNQSWTARLVDERGKIRAEQQSTRARRPNQSLMPQAAAVSRALPALPETRNRQDDLRPAVARLLPAVFPDNPITLGGLDTIYLSSERALDLKQPQVNALLAWLHGGGHLVVGVEQLNHLTGPGEWLQKLLPMQLTDMTSLAPHPELQSWLQSKERFDGKDYEFNHTGQVGRNRSGSFESPFARLPADPKFEETPMQVATGRPRDGRALVGPASSPLVVTADRGRGQITLLTFAPELEPFRSWKQAPYFWAKMTDLPPELMTQENFTRYPGRFIDGVFGGMIDSRQIRKLPVGWLLLLLIGYLVVIGPLDQYWLKKLNKQMLTWLTFPAYVAFFSLLIYFIGYKLRAGETEWNELHVVDVIPHGASADLRGWSFGSIYSPVNARYTFVCDQPFATMRGEYIGNYGGGQETSRSSIEQRADGVQTSAVVPVWTSQLFVTDWLRQGPAPLNAVVTAERVTVENNLDVKLTGAKLVLENKVLELGELPARQSKTFDRRGLRETPLKNYVQTHGTSFLNAVNSRQRAFGDTSRGTINDITNAAVAASFVSHLTAPNNYDTFNAESHFELTGLVERGDAVLLAWASNHSLIKPLNQFPARRGSRDTLLRLVVQMKNSK
jgi:hypothetical protein